MRTLASLAAVAVFDQIARCNTQPFILDGGDGGHTEFPGDEFLVGSWLGRYLKLIE